MVQQLKQLAVVLLTAYCLRQTSAKVPELSSNNSNVDFVFVKFNQVGGSSVMQLLLNLVDPRSFKTFLAGKAQFGDVHRVNKVIGGMAHSGLPPGMFAVTILRDPMDKAMSSFFKHQFPTVLHEATDVASGVSKYMPSSELDKWLGTAATRDTNGAIKNLTTLMPALRYFMAHPELQFGHKASARRQYSEMFSSDLAKAKHVLEQFALVGVTERHAAFDAKLCALTAPARPAPASAAAAAAATTAKNGTSAADSITIRGCTAETALYARRDYLRPALADFPPEFVNELRERFIDPTEQHIYEIARALSPS